MPLDLSAVGRHSAPTAVTWDSTRAILYALGVGAGSDDPELELEFTTENSIDIEQAVLPTFPIALTVGGEEPWHDVDATKILHADQSLVLHATLPPFGSAQMETGVDAIYDKVSGALVELSNRMTDPTGRLLAEMVAGAFLRGE